MEMKCRAYVKEVVKKTKAEMFKDVREFDVLSFSCEIKKAGNGYRGTRATYICITNETTNECVWKSFNEIGAILSCFELEEFEDEGEC